MNSQFISLFFIQMSYGILYISVDNFEIKYLVTFENSCHTEKDRFHITFGTSIENCVKECSARQHCLALDFRSRINVCELFSTSELSQLNHGDCLYVEKGDINVIKTPCQKGCKYGEVCETTVSGKGRCVIKECVNVTVPDHGTILGNLRQVGNTIRYKCDTGYKVTNANAECLHTGDWSANIECLMIPTIGNKCTSDTDCKETEGTCIHKKCFCNRLYRYNTTISNCSKVCQSMSSEFAVFNNKSILGFNFGVDFRREDKVEDCVNACIDNADCLSFEAWPIPKLNKVGCNIGSVTAEMIEDAYPQNLRNFSGITLYTRKCN